MRHVMDHTVGLNAALATVAALHQRRHTGKGAHVDVAAREVASSLAGEALMAAAAGALVERMGNEDYRRAPHGLYATKKTDRWISIAIESEQQWQALLRVMRRPELSLDPKFATPERRHAMREVLDGIISQWCATLDADETAEKLQEAGIPAHVSWNTEDIVHDPHLRHRGAIVQVREADGRERAAVGFPACFAKSKDVGIDRGTPDLGEHESYVYGELLGIGTKEYNELVADGIIY
jgi:benzylsuccinate CoA-transferase BbsF subunit